MLTIEGLVVAGLGPPGAFPFQVAQGKPAAVDFAMLLAAAGMAGLAATSPATAQDPLRAAPTPAFPPAWGATPPGGPPEGATALVAIPDPMAVALGLAAPPSPHAESPPGVTLEPRPDRSSEAAPDTDIEQLATEPSLIASLLAASTISPALPAPLTMPVGDPGPMPEGASLAGATVAPRTVAEDGTPRPAAPARSLAAPDAALPPANAQAAAPPTTDDAGSPATPPPAALRPGPESVPDAPPAAQASLVATSGIPEAPASESPVASGNSRRTEERLGAALQSIAPHDRSDIASDWARSLAGEDAARAAITVPPAADGGQPEDRLGAILADVAPHDRAAVASAWNRSGGRFNDATASPPETPGALAAPVATEPASPLVAAPVTPAPSASDATGIAGEPVSAAADAPPVSALDQPDDRAIEPAAISLAEPASPAQPGNVSQPPPIVARPTDRAAGPAAVETRDSAVLHARLADSVLEAVRSGDNSVRLVLNPPDLGHLDIRVERGEHGMRVELVASTAGAADLIQQQLPALVSGMEARSIRVDHAEVRHTSSGSATSTFGNGSDARQPGGDSADGRQQWERPDWSDAARLASEPSPTAAPGTRDRLIDMVA